MYDLKKSVGPRVFVPVGNDVAVHIYEQQETEGGIILPQNDKNSWRSAIARVVAIGPDCKWVKEGDLILLAPSTMLRVVRILRHEYFLCTEDKIPGIIQPEYHEQVLVGGTDNNKSRIAVK